MCWVTFLHHHMLTTIQHVSISSAVHRIYVYQVNSVYLAEVTDHLRRKEKSCSYSNCDNHLFDRDFFCTTLYFQSLSLVGAAHFSGNTSNKNILHSSVRKFHLDISVKKILQSWFISERKYLLEKCIRKSPWFVCLDLSCTGSCWLLHLRRTEKHNCAPTRICLLTYCEKEEKSSLKNAERWFMMKGQVVETMNL